MKLVERGSWWVPQCPTVDYLPAVCCCSACWCGPARRPVRGSSAVSASCQLTASVDGSAENALVCALCEAIMTALDSALVDPTSEAAVTEFLLQVCNYVGPNLESMCREFVAEYTGRLPLIMIRM